MADQDSQSSSTLSTGRKKSDSKPARLPSLRGPRDLTLGGVRKKTFTPNIPVRKERIKQEPVEQCPSAVRKQKLRRDRQKVKGRGRGRQEIIQSHSIFEAGPSAEAIKKRSDSSFSAGGGGTKDAIEKPTIKKEDYDEDYERTKSEEVLRNLGGDTSFIADLENDDKLPPVSLPMSQSEWPPGKKKSLVPSATKPKNFQLFSKKRGKSVAGTSLHCSETFMSDEEVENKEKDPTDLILFQLPDTLPAVPPLSESEIKIEMTQETMKVKKEPGIPENEPTEKNNCTLERLSEGYVGKLQVMKSGRCRLLLGQIILELNKGTTSAFHEEIVSVRLPPEADETSRGHMTVLGDICQKLICVPDMEHLIMEAK